MEMAGNGGNLIAEGRQESIQFERALTMSRATIMLASTRSNEGQIHAETGNAEFLTRKGLNRSGNQAVLTNYVERSMLTMEVTERGPDRQHRCQLLSALGFTNAINNDHKPAHENAELEQKVTRLPECMDLENIIYADNQTVSEALIDEKLVAAQKNKRKPNSHTIKSFFSKS